MGSEKYDQMAQIVAQARAQFEEFQSGKKVAASRARKALQELKSLAQAARIEILDIKKGSEGGEEAQS